MIINKVKTLIKAFQGVLLKIWYIPFNKESYYLPLSENADGSEMVTISLTSYGRRVSKTLPYTLISLLKQSQRPNRIVVWLDNNWNDDNLPHKLQEFKKVGVEFKFCNDFKSFKKLIPALQEGKDEIIITCDDDLFYNKYMVERLLDAHRKYPNTICCQLAHGIRFMDGKMLPYNQWEEEIFDTSECVFPLGGSGCLYKRDFLYEDVVNYDLAKSLCPKADDVWFYFMGFKKNTQRYVLPYIKDIVIPLDAFYQFFHRGSSLMEDNLSQGLNDKQIQAVIEHYSLNVNEIYHNNRL